MTLYEGVAGKEYWIQELSVDPVISKRLEALGFNEGTKIIISARKKEGSMIVKIRGTRLALGKHITTHILIEEGRGEMR